MAIAIKCGSCGKTTQLAASLAGRELRCTSCRGLLTIPTAPVKACSICHHDVSHQHRWKDGQGRYYCDTCWANRSSEMDMAPSPVKRAAPQKKTSSTPLPKRKAGADAEVRPPVIVPSKKEWQELDEPEEMIGCGGCGRVHRWSQFNEQGLCPTCAARPPMHRSIVKETEKASVGSRFIRGGVLGVVSEDHCISDEQMRLSTTDRSAGGLAKRLAFLAVLGVGGFIAVVGVIVVIAMSQAGIRDRETAESDRPAHTEISGPEPRLPKVVVRGDSDSCLAFKNWRVEGGSIASKLTGVMTWNGERKIDSIDYVLRKDGVVKDRGSINVAGGSGVFRKDEPVEVEIFVTFDIADCDVEIVVQY